MGRWRAKIVSTCVVYTAGFLTAIYFLAPPPAGKTDSFRLPSGHHFDRERLIRKVNDGLHGCVSLGRQAAAHVADKIRDYQEGHDGSND